MRDFFYILRSVCTGRQGGGVTHKKKSDANLVVLVMTHVFKKHFGDVKSIRKSCLSVSVLTEFFLYKIYFGFMVNQNRFGVVDSLVPFKSPEEDPDS